MLRLGLVIVILSLVNPLFAQDVHDGSRLTALGNTGVALQDVWTLQSNQAGIASIKRPVAAIACESSFFNSAITTQSAIFAFPYHRNVFGFSLRSYGMDEYREQKIGFAFARGFGETVFASLSFNIHQLKISRYGSAGAWSVEAGLQYKAGENLIIGAHIANPNRSAYQADLNAIVPVLFELGASLRFTDKVLLSSAIAKELDSAAGFKCGIEYNIMSEVFLRGGAVTNPFRQSAGFGYKYHSLNVDIAVTSHPDLGFSPQISLGYEF
ncbi:hypothetical protein BDE36_2272 [Arcticibacter tournemirensis]|uniref:PorV/PorQ family protein n=1 Tax=Arcticibacter tournemirensis TaxID=699437 RepID=A0A5M9HE16_9SPHI|nr:hypothetical protein [Arcticibacter tournemirensis]KAA8485020.1 hypothetical protein F1649_05140 [Arcticibacter tournemirensis]TQM50526.1 hypothetical protein BDE36_2272 [Arcticibacter tournemirensis]